MNRSLDVRLEKLEAGRGVGRPQIIWTMVSDGNGRLRAMTRAELDAEIAERKAAGTLGDMDELLLIRWETGDTRTHEECLAQLEQGEP